MEQHKLSVGSLVVGFVAGLVAFMLIVYATRLQDRKRTEPKLTTSCTDQTVVVTTALLLGQTSPHGASPETFVVCHGYRVTWAPDSQNPTGQITSFTIDFKNSAPSDDSSAGHYGWQSTSPTTLPTTGPTLRGSYPCYCPMYYEYKVTITDGQGVHVYDPRGIVM